MNHKLPPGTLQCMWEDPASWRGSSYVRADDPRIIVPKRSPIWGWTVNWAHSRAAMTCFAGIVGVMAVLGAAAMTRNPVAECAATVFVVLSVAAGCQGLADPGRYEERNE